MQLRNFYLHQTVEENSLQEVAKKIQNQNPSEADEINKFLKDIRWQISEWDVFDELAIFFSQRQGLLLNGYETQDFLKPFVKEADLFRKQNIPARNDLTDLEKQILRVLNIDLSDVNAVANGIVAEQAVI